MFLALHKLLVVALVTVGTAHCHARGVLPDPTCTPGATNSAVTQATIGRTICKSGWTATVRPSSSYTNALKRRQLVEYGYADMKPSDYEEDHLVSLELGGDPRDPRNLWPERGPSPNPKDRVENLLHKRVCSDQMPLTEAQREIATDWTVVDGSP